MQCKIDFNNKINNRVSNKTLPLRPLWASITVLGLLVAQHSAAQGVLEEVVVT